MEVILTTSFYEMDCWHSVSHPDGKTPFEEDWFNQEICLGPWPARVLVQCLAVLYLSGSSYYLLHYLHPLFNLILSYMSDGFICYLIFILELWNRDLKVKPLDCISRNHPRQRVFFVFCFLPDFCLMAANAACCLDKWRWLFKKLMQALTY